jgi:hypothetical protein
MENIQTIPLCLAARKTSNRINQPLRSWLISNRRSATVPVAFDSLPSGLYRAGDVAAGKQNFSARRARNFALGRWRRTRGAIVTAGHSHD